MKRIRVKDHTDAIAIAGLVLCCMAAFLIGYTTETEKEPSIHMIHVTQVELWVEEKWERFAGALSLRLLK